MIDPNNIIIGAFSFAGVALAAFLAFMNGRASNKNNKVMSDRERLGKLEEDVESLRTQIGTLNKQLEEMSDRWRAVIGTVREMFWDVYQQWPAGLPMMRFRSQHIEALRKAEVEDIVPVNMHHESERENTP